MKVRILIIEDVDTDAQLLKLEVLKYDPEMEIMISNSMEGLSELLLSFDPNVILSDFDLKTFNAFDVLELLAKLDLNIPCIIVTGVINDEEIVAKLILKGAIGFIQKKDLSHIRSSLHRVLSDLNTSFTSNFDTYEQKLRLLFKLKEMQFNFNKLAMDIPEISGIQQEFMEFTDQMMKEIEGSYSKLPLLKGKK